MAGHSKYKTNRTGWEAERLVPNQVPWHKKKMIAEHTARYEFAAHYVRNKHVIDLACGTGYGCLSLRKAGARSVIGVDIDSAAIDYAIKQYSKKGIRYIKADVTKTLLPAHSADIVSSFETVEHIQDDKKFIHEVRRVLKPDGTFIMSTPNVEFSTGTNPYHVREYTFSQCRNLLLQFSSIQVFGQRKVNRIIFKGMKLIPVITAFRPWESPTIHHINSQSDTNYCYFIFVCKV